MKGKVNNNLIFDKDMKLKKGNIYDKIPSELSNELFEIIAKKDSLKIERIISKGHTTPKEKWYDQKFNEFVILIQGSAIISFEDGNNIEMKKGDYINIPKHCKHRVEQTSSNPEAIWLAVHY